jgi:hypothetical protein
MVRDKRNKRLAKLLDECRNDLALFHEAVLGRPKLWAKQEEIARSVVDNKYTVVPTANAMGKTWFAPSIVTGWLYTRPNSMVVTTSSSNAQLVNALWGGIKYGKKTSRIKLFGRITEGSANPQMLVLGPKWYAIGFAARKLENLQGHRPDGGELLVITDESSGIEQPIWDALESLGAKSYLMLGNPIRATGHFRTIAEMARRGTPGYRLIQLSAFDSPHSHLTDEEVIINGLPTGLANRSWIENARRTFGEASLFWKTRVLAQFPDDDYDQLIPLSWLDLCYMAKRPDAFGGERCLAIDIAKGTGRDRTVWMVGDKLGLLHCEVSTGTDLIAAAVRAKQPTGEWGIRHDMIVYDGGGWCGPDFGHHLSAVGIEDAYPHFGAGSGGNRMANRRTRCAWSLRTRLDPSIQFSAPAAAVIRDPRALPQIVMRSDRGIVNEGPPPSTAWTIPPHVIGGHWEELREEIQAIRYVHGERKLECEPKEKLVERIGRSPDLADTVVMMAGMLFAS